MSGFVTVDDNVTKRLVVKIGTSTLIHKSGDLNLRRIDQLARVLADLKNHGMEIVLVSSGAIGVGKGKMPELAKRSLSLSEKQALAAVGQGALMHIYEKSFSEYGQVVAQVLITRLDLDDRVRFINARNTITELLKLGVIPIINENDTVSSEEIQFGDNDTLAALVAVLINADGAILLTDIDGLYDNNPKDHEDAEKISIVTKIDDTIREMAGSAGSAVGTGGMTTKISAAEITMGAGIPMLIALGEDPSLLYDVIDGKQVGTLFLPDTKQMHSRDSWLRYGTKPKGSVVIDDGAEKALLEGGKSLLPIGVVDAMGIFYAGDIVYIKNSRNIVLGKGISNFEKNDILKIRGLHSDEIAKVIEKANFDVVIHRDNMGLESRS